MLRSSQRKKEKTNYAEKGKLVPINQDRFINHEGFYSLGGGAYYNTKTQSLFILLGKNFATDPH